VASGAIRDDREMKMRLRQVVMVAADLEAVERRIETELGVELCFRDPGVAEFGLRNALFPIGDQLLEVVSPTRPGTTAGRLLDKRGGDGGYMVILEVYDLEALRDRIGSARVRIVHEARTDGIVGLHLHPADVGGAILSVDRADTWGEWPWAGPVWRDHVRTDQVAAVVAVEIEAIDPHAMASRWSEILGRPARADEIGLDQGVIRFVEAGDRGEGVAGFDLQAGPAGHVRTTMIAGCRFRLVGA
jgi:hypothetical protein